MSTSGPHTCTSCVTMFIHISHQSIKGCCYLILAAAIPLFPTCICISLLSASVTQCDGGEARGHQALMWKVGCWRSGRGGMF